MQRERASVSLTEQVAVLLLCGGAIIGPMCLGATGPWPRFGLEAVGALAGILWALSGRRRLTLLAMPCGICLAALVQLIPLPDWLLVPIAPVSAGAWKLAFANEPGRWGTISIDPGATAAAIRRLFVGLVTVAVVCDVGRRLRYRRQLIAALSLAGLMILGTGILFPVDQKARLLLGFVQLDGPQELKGRQVTAPIETPGYGFLVPTVITGIRYLANEGGTGDGFGPYICSNHYAGAICLTIPVAIAGWLFMSKGRVPQWARCAISGGVVAASFWSVAMMARSRAGAASLMLAFLALGLLSAERPVFRRCMEILFGFAITAMLAATLVMYGPSTGLENHLPKSIREPLVSAMHDTRVFAAHVAHRMFRASPLFGTGLDTYGELFPRYTPGRNIIYYAHNDFAQLLAETGLAGMSIVAILAVILITRGFRFYRDIIPSARILEAGPWAAFAGIAAHSAFDWNMHVPANAFLAAIVAGLSAATGLPSRLVAGDSMQTALAPQMRSPAIRPGSPPSSRNRPPLVAGPVATGIYVAGCCTAMALLTRDAASAAMVKSLRTAVTHSQVTPVAQDAGSDTVLALSTAIVAGERMAHWDPANAHLALAIGHAELQMSAAPLTIDDANESLDRARQRFLGACRLGPELAKRVALEK